MGIPARTDRPSVDVVKWVRRVFPGVLGGTMRLDRRWTFASLLSVVVLLSGSDLCMFFKCVPLMSKEAGHALAHDTCGETGTTQNGHHDGRRGDCARTCDLLVTLSSGPQLFSPQGQGPATPLAVFAAPRANVTPPRTLRGPAPPGQSHSPPPAPLLNASGIRAPPNG
jgi:hypothetical protein